MLILVKLRKTNIKESNILFSQDKLLSSFNKQFFLNSKKFLSEISVYNAC